MSIPKYAKLRTFIGKLEFSSKVEAEPNEKIPLNIKGFLRDGRILEVIVGRDGKFTNVTIGFNQIYTVFHNESDALAFLKSNF